MSADGKTGDELLLFANILLCSVNNMQYSMFFFVSRVAKNENEIIAVLYYPLHHFLLRYMAI